MEEKICPPELVKSGKPIIGWFSTYLPEEILLAAGFLPYRIMESSPRISGCPNSRSTFAKQDLKMAEVALEEEVYKRWII